MSMRTRVGPVAALSIAALALVGCSSGTPSGGTDGEAVAGEQVDLRWIMSADSQAEIDVWNHLARRFHGRSVPQT